MEQAHYPVDLRAAAVRKPCLDRGLAQTFGEVELELRIGRAIAVTARRLVRPLDVDRHGQFDIVAEGLLEPARFTVDVDAVADIAGGEEPARIRVLAGIEDAAVAAAFDPVMGLRLAAIAAAEKPKRQLGPGQEPRPRP